MSSKVKYFDSNYNYINPVRHFKANDPYYYEIDNIPIKQLEESDNFLKDQIDGLLKECSRLGDVDRSTFKELRPYVKGVDRKVRVCPGRYTARVNDAYAINPIQFITQTLGFSNTDTATTPVADTNGWTVETNVGDGVSSALNIFQQGLNGNALNMNGLAERTFTYPIPDEDGIDIPGTTEFLNATSIAEYIDLRLGTTTQSSKPRLPNIIGQLWRSGANLPATETLQLIKNVFTPGTSPDASQSNKLESAFIKRWRGAIRTAIVDVPEELAITVPDFDANDFYYIDENGTRQSLEAGQRIDLLFIYSKAVDQNVTNLVGRDSTGSPKTISKATLGILKGAGIGVSRSAVGTPGGDADLQSLENVPIMLAHPGDEQNSNGGFQTSAGTIKGSFPAPDDLLNLAPVLSENLETNSIALIGQSILPIAYIRVKNSGGVPDILSDSDIIDIRPFFRTAELAYNERAGIAAATPQISIANPVVSEAHLDKVRKEVYADLRGRIDALNIPEAAPSRVVGMGTVCGGIEFGAEGALFRQAAPNILGRPIEQVTFGEMADAAEQFFNYLPGSITMRPGWDPAPWSLTKTPTPGRRAADHIHVCWPIISESTNNNQYWLPPFNRSVGPNNNNTIDLLKASVGNASVIANHAFGTKRPWRDQTDGFKNADGTYQRQNVVITFVRKVINIDRGNVPWMADYTVNAQLLNCVPLSSGNDIGSKRQGRSAGASNIWIDKFRDYFVINVAWVSDDFNRRTHDQDYYRDGAEWTPWANRNDVNQLAGFALPEIPIPTPGDFQQYGSRVRAIPGEDPIEGNVTQGEKVLQLINQNATAGTGLTDQITDISYFTNVTPILYPTVQFEIIGHNAQMAANSPRGTALTDGRTPTIQLI